MGIKETALALHLMYPKDYIAFSRGYNPAIKHYGVDMAWNSAHGGKYPPVYAPADGKVVAARYDKGGYGYYVMIEHAEGVRTLMAHMKSDLTVKVGDKVVRGQRIGTQGSTGNSTGPHVHFEVRLNGSKVNPVDYVFAFPNQTVNADTQKEYGIKHYEPIKYVGTPVERNSTVDQLKVITKTLRARKEPNLNGEVLGYVKQGIYDVHGITDADGYRWYQIDEFWCANNAKETWCNYLPKTEPHYDLTLHNLTESQKNTLVTYAKESGFEYTVTEL